MTIAWSCWLYFKTFRLIYKKGTVFQFEILSVRPRNCLESLDFRKENVCSSHPLLFDGYEEEGSEAEIDREDAFLMKIYRIPLFDRQVTFA